MHFSVFVYFFQPVQLGGKAAILAARQAKNMGPTLLGPSSMAAFTNMEDIEDPYSLVGGDKYQMGLHINVSSKDSVGCENHHSS